MLFDQGTPVPLRMFLAEHIVDTAYERGWSQVKDSELLKAAEIADYQLSVTTDQNLKYKQDLRQRRLAILVLSTTSWRQFKTHAAEIAEIINEIQVADYREFRI
ncbi:MAG TPA: hypothetical protein VFD70_25320 [Anaerolineae bacterium]|nr:hypothetical protein [Anaerolineae bacterium]